jgi:hypothetical protein
MKKIILIFGLLTQLSALCQAKKWFASISTGGSVGGPSASLKNQMIKQGFNQSGTYNFLGLTGTTEYPEKYLSGYFLVRFGKLLKERKSVFFIAGLSEKGEVTGFKNQGYVDFLGILGGSSGPRPIVNYSIYQASAGYQYDAIKTRAKLGLGPSLFLMNYQMNEENARSVLLPGIILTGRFPLGRERKLVGLELVLDTRLAPPANMKSDVKESPDTFVPGKVNMCAASAGIALCFRK